MTNPSANQNRPPRPDPYRYFACVSWAWPVQGSKEAESAEKAEQVLPLSLLDKESPAGEWAPIPVQAVLSASVTPAMPYAHATQKMTNILDDICDDGPVLSPELARPTGVSKATQDGYRFEIREFRASGIDTMHIST